MHYKSCSPTKRGKNNNNIVCAFREAHGLTRRIYALSRPTYGKSPSIYDVCITICIIVA